MERDAGDVGAWLARWAVEGALALLVLGGVGSGLRASDAGRVVLAVALGAALVDRIRLRLDNRSLAVAVGAGRLTGVSAARRSGTEADAVAEEDDGEDARPREATSAGAGPAADAPDEPDDGGLDREVIADLIGEDPKDLNADDVADLVRRAERSAGRSEEPDEQDVADIIREAERHAGEDDASDGDDGPEDAADLIREAEPNSDVGPNRSGDRDADGE